MKNKALVYPLLIVLISSIIYLFYPSSGKQLNTEETVITAEKYFNYLPSSTTGQMIIHKYYTLSYNEKAEQAEWVAYELKKEQLSRIHRKRPFFRLDKKVKTQSADYRNYINSGYSKGHLCPAGDRKFSSEAFNETFLTSNIAPQKLAFNAGIWNRLEQKVRYWASKERQLYVVTGGVLDADLPTIGSEKVAVPQQFYKIILDYTKPEIKAIAFLIPHRESKQSLYTFVVSIDEVEALTGIDFFPALPDGVEQQLEASSNYKNWSFK